MNFHELTTAIGIAATYEIWLASKTPAERRRMSAALAKRERRADRNKELRTKAKR